MVSKYKIFTVCGRAVISENLAFVTAGILVWNGDGTNRDNIVASYDDYHYGETKDCDYALEKAGVNFIPHTNILNVEFSCQTN